ncbi:glutaminase [Ancylomarina salipaludis]|uniref:Glutaminase n=1 Tax=Ancylomarina salipaludis TaxID=2501299 RepID=A0A4Q1JM03_9BACT|nr:glutaminase [Ancylomarina salipaludis]RXQ95558.1 glutaminase [Ancylomarina salipaludis]
MELKQILQDIYTELADKNDKGQVASYIPELANINPNKFGIHYISLEGNSYGLGDHQEKFSCQSIIKVLSLCLAIKNEGVKIWKRVGVEPSGTPFNSLVQLEYEHGIPRNPFINAGAIVICDILLSQLENPKDDFLAFVQKLALNSNINYNPKISASEKAHGYRNAALINMMKSFDNIENSIDDVLDFYYDICSIEMTCEELAQTFLLFANNGCIPNSNERIITTSQSKRINAIMQCCGFYDEAGEFSFKVGLPGKSGVGGGIVAIHPGKYAVAVWSPRLNKKGNSYKGILALELLTTKSELSIF